MRTPRTAHRVHGFLLNNLQNHSEIVWEIPVKAAINSYVSSELIPR